MSHEERSVYNAETGVFTGVVIAVHDVLLDANTPSGHSTVIGRYDKLSQRVDVSVPPQIVDDVNPHGCVIGKKTVHKVIDYQPPPPSSEHVWNPDTKRWQLSAAAQAKAAARSAAIARIAELEASQHPHVRELLLGSLSARPRLQAIEDVIQALQATLDS